MEPLIGIRIRNQSRRFQPGEELICEYQLDAVEANEVQAVEASVLWHTEGKGDEDLGVHFFERRVTSDEPDRDLRSQREFRTVLPCSPLTYSGVTVKIRWCVRVRAFLRWGREAFFEQTFVLGDVPLARPVRRSRVAGLQGAASPKPLEDSASALTDDQAEASGGDGRRETEDSDESV